MHEVQRRGTIWSWLNQQHRASFLVIRRTTEDQVSYVVSRHIVIRSWSKQDLSASLLKTIKTYACCEYWGIEYSQRHRWQTGKEITYVLTSNKVSEEDLKKKWTFWTELLVSKDMWKKTLRRRWNFIFGESETNEDYGYTDWPISVQENVCGQRNCRSRYTNSRWNSSWN